MKKRRDLSYTGIAVLVYQIVSLFPLLYILTASGSFSLILSKGILSFFFDAGICALPRIEAVFLSWLYRKTMNEVVVYFALLILALIAGLVFHSVMKGERKNAVRYVLAVFCVIDVIVKVLLLSFNQAFALPYRIIGIVFALACLGLICYDIMKNRKESV